MSKHILDKTNSFFKWLNSIFLWILYEPKQEDLSINKDWVGVKLKSTWKPGLYPVKNTENVFVYLDRSS